MTRHRSVTMILAAFAAAGLIGAHVLAYAIALPNATVRAALLRTTGHGYFSAAVVVAVVAGIFGSFAAAALGVRSSGALRIGWRHAAVRIAALQIAAFVVLEIAERAAVNIPPVAIGPRLLVVGIAVQALIACLAALVVALVCRVAAIVWRALARTLVRPARAAPRFVRISDAARAPLAFAGGFDSRAPPFSPR